MPKYFSIKEWSQSERPREKLLLQGKEQLSNAELLAILIGSGNREESAVDLCKRILASVHNNITNLGKLSVQELQQFKGVGQAKALAIVAALELGRRKELFSEDEVKINSSASVFNYMFVLLGDLDHEEFWVLYLNNANTVLKRSQISKGGITATLVDVRLVLKKALQVGAVALVLVHNHPSGVLQVSEADKAITQKIKKAAAALDIQLLDHVIITKNSHVSLADENMI